MQPLFLFGVVLFPNTTSARISVVAESVQRNPSRQFPAVFPNAAGLLDLKFGRDPFASIASRIGGNHLDDRFLDLRAWGSGCK